MATANEALLDAEISHSIGIQRYGTATTRKIVALLRRVEPRLLARISSEDLSQLSKKRADLLLASVRKIIREGTGDIKAALTDELRAFADYEAGYQEDLFRKVVPVEIDFLRPSNSQLWAAVNSRPFQGRLLKDWYGDLEGSMFAQLRDTIRMGVVEGRTTDQIVREIRGTRALGYNDGVFGKYRRGVTTTVRTAVSHTANAAREHLYDENLNLVKGVRWVSTLDGRTSTVCRARDGKVYKPGKGPRPPAHPNCRSTTVPVLKSWKELGINLKDAPAGTRASMDGQAPGDLNYNDWLKTKPIAFQNDVLGVKKARLFRKGGLHLDRFVDHKGEAYTLDELRKRDAGAFERAGF